MTLVPALAWLDSFCNSAGTALDQGMTAEVSRGVNQLTYVAKISWRSPISTKSALVVWNLFQKWAGRNKTGANARVDMHRVRHPVTGEERVLGFTVELFVRERLGLPKNDAP